MVGKGPTGPRRVVDDPQPRDRQGSIGVIGLDSARAISKSRDRRGDDGGLERLTNKYKKQKQKHEKNPFHRHPTFCELQTQLSPLHLSFAVSRGSTSYSMP